MPIALVQSGSTASDNDDRKGNGHQSAEQAGGKPREGGGKLIISLTVTWGTSLPREMDPLYTLLVS
jgi:hypothetical protein